MGKPPTQSRLVRPKTVAFAEAKDDKKKKGDKKPDDAAEAKKPDDKQPDGKGDVEATQPEAAASAAPEATAPEAAAAVAPEAAAAPIAAAQPTAAAPEVEAAAPAVEAAAPEVEAAAVAEPKSAPEDEEPERAVVTVSTPRAHTETMAMPSELGIGKPPELPVAAPPPAPVATGAVESPTNMPIPKHVPAGDPDDAAAPPGRVPAGDSRSLRKSGEFSLVYRMGTFVISRAGAIGKRGVWRVVEYPTSSAASHGYAKECSRFISEGFSDYRD